MLQISVKSLNTKSDFAQLNGKKTSFLRMHDVTFCDHNCGNGKLRN
ncbi:hypothetical protein NITUZ_30081 [Candidatus Nitrosotenuis uzonensis]|uniref:Uncharacterized protein n=1 Tax=Candidatus Nitrosotenuis uzonensis TaxID=1407055 RepID=V6AS36_9ARCH|nr:hypothetical protein NITUZ_30081 [Candidatus Nitrosotenuis uzonensis]